LFDQVGDDLGVGLGDELVALRGELALELEIIFDDAVVDDDDAPGAVAMGVGIFFRGAAVRGPAGVPDAEGALDGVLEKNLFEIAQLAGSAPDFERGSGRAANSDASRIVSAVFEPPQPLNDDGNYFLGTNIANNSAHKAILCDSKLNRRERTAQLRSFFPALPPGNGRVANCRSASRCETPRRGGLLSRGVLAGWAAVY